MINVRNDVSRSVKDIPKYAQYYRIALNSQSSTDAVGRPMVHKSAFLQTTGKFSMKLYEWSNVVIKNI